MPCFSSVQKTKMTDASRLAEAMKALGFNDVKSSETQVSSSVASFSRYRNGDAFSTTTRDAEVLKSIQRKYAELSLRAWSKRTGYAVASVDGNSYTLVNRRIK